ncbi:MAG: hypothetical protein WED87_05605 [Dehalococcoidia bacterium]
MRSRPSAGKRRPGGCYELAQSVHGFAIHDGATHGRRLHDTCIVLTHVVWRLAAAAARGRDKGLAEVSACALDDAQPVVLTLDGQSLGTLGHFSGDRFRLLRPDGTSDWTSNRAIYLEHPRYLELMCLEEGLSRYVL